MYQSVTRGLAPWHLKCIPEYRSATKYMKTCQLHCTPVSVSNAGYSGLSPGLYTGISVSDKVYEDQCQLHCYPVYLSVTQGTVACHLKCTPEYQSATKYMKTCQLHCTPMYQSVTWGIHLECIDLLGISQQQIYKDLSATLFPGVSFSNPGYNGLSAGMFETVFGVSVSDKVYENMSDIVYPGVSFSVLVNDAGYGRSGVYAKVSTYLIIYFNVEDSFIHF